MMDYRKLKKKNLIIIISCIVAVFSVFFIERIINSNNDTLGRKQIIIKDIDQYAQYLPNERITAIQEAIFDNITQNSDKLPSSITGEIRKDSVIHKKIEKENCHFLNMVVDIPELEQSYQVFDFYSQDKNNSYISPNESIIVMCPEQEKVIFQSFHCNSKYDKKTRNLIVFKVLKSLEPTDFTVINTSNNYKEIRVAPTNNGKMGAYEATQKAIKELGFPSDLFKIKVEE